MRVVVCGGGVIGACAAYFLTRRGVDVTVVERTAVAGAASGKAGGFLALDWSAGSPLDALSRRSFQLHADLVAEVDGDWGYRRLSTYSGYLAAGYGAHRPASILGNARLAGFRGFLRLGPVKSSRSGGCCSTFAVVFCRGSL